MPATKLDINLLSDEDISYKPLGKILKWSLSYGRYIIIATQIIVLLAFFSRFKLDQTLSDLRANISEKIDILKVLSPIVENTTLLQNRLAILSSLETNRNIYTNIIKEVQNQTPQNVIIDQIIFSKDKLTISGKASDNGSFSTFLNFIRTSDSFSQINLDEVGRLTDDNSIFFKLNMQLFDKPKELVQSK